MLKSWRLWLTLIIALIIVVIIIASSHSFQYCIQEANDYYSRAGVPPNFVLLQSIKNCVGVYIIAKNAFIITLATVVIALFTFTLWSSNQEQIKRHREVERAYIWGGGPLDRNNPKVLVLTVNNYGKTPGLLTEFAVGFCPRTNIPDRPKYTIREKFHDWIPPVPELVRPVRSIDLPSFPDPLIFGRLWFEDVWGMKHSTGFMLVTIKDAVGKQGTSAIIPREIMEKVSSAYTNWN